MKHINKILLLFFAFGIAMQSCKKDEKINTFEGGTAPILTSTIANNSTFQFKAEDSAKTFGKFSWTNPNYTFTTGISSQNVTYSIELDSTGKNFMSSRKISYVPNPSFSLEKSFTISQFNELLLQLKYDSNSFRGVEVRIKATLGSEATALYSNVLSYTVKAYPIPPKVAPPTTNELFITGKATPIGWMCGCPNDANANSASQKFTRIDAVTYELPRITLTGGDEYLIVPRYGNWGAVFPDPEKYGSKVATNSMIPEGGDFDRFGNNYKAPAVTGDYKIVMDFQLGKFTVTKL